MPNVLRCTASLASALVVAGLLLLALGTPLRPGRSSLHTRLPGSGGTPSPPAVARPLRLSGSSATRHNDTHGDGGAPDSYGGCRLDDLGCAASAAAGVYAHPSQRTATVLVVMATLDYREMYASWACRAAELGLRHLLFAADEGLAAAVAGWARDASKAGLAPAAVFHRPEPHAVGAGTPEAGRRSGGRGGKAGEGFQSARFVQTVTRKLWLVHELLTMGFDVWLSDVDVFFFQDPLPWFAGGGACDLEYQQNVNPPGPQVGAPIDPLREGNSGFFLARHGNPSVTAFLREAIEECRRWGKRDDQTNLFHVLQRWACRGRAALTVPWAGGRAGGLDPAVCQQRARARPRALAQNQQLSDAKGGEGASPPVLRVCPLHALTHAVKPLRARLSDLAGPVWEQRVRNTTQHEGGGTALPAVVLHFNYLGTYALKVGLMKRAGYWLLPAADQGLAQGNASSGGGAGGPTCRPWGGT